MSAAKSQKNPDIPTDLQPYYDAPSASRTWARWAVRIVALVIFIILAIMFVKWVWHQTHTNDNKPASSSSQKAGNSAAGQHSTKPITLGGSSEGDSSNSQSSSGDSASTAGNTGAAAQTVGQSADLTNTGPGETLAVFVAASLFFALVYELRLRKVKS